MPHAVRRRAIAAIAALLVLLISPADAQDEVRSHPLWAGTGAYRLSSEQIVENTQTARRLEAAGVILFSYDGLADAAHGPGYVSQVGRAAFQF